MTNPKREQIEAAYFATEQLVLLATVVRESPAVKDYREMILKVLPPRPQPTMADIEWDNDKHYLAEAEHSYRGKVIMLYRHAGLRQIQYLRAGGANEILFAAPADLTPTGKRYTLTEVQDD